MRNRPIGDRQTGVIRLFLVDDDRLFREGLCRLLDDVAAVEVVGEADNAADALERAVLARAHVALVDVRMPSTDGVELCRELRSRCPDTAVVMLTAVDDDEATYQAVLAGAAAYVLKSTRSEELVRIVEQVASGCALLDARVAARMVDRIRERTDDESVLRGLSDTEHEILDLISQGMTNREIAHQVHLAEKTVKNHVSRLLKKLDMERRAEIILYMAERNRRDHLWT